MSKQLKIDNFDPNGVGIHNGRFIGLPFDEEDAQVVLIPAPWDLTVSYNDGTHSGPENILESSYQLDLYDDYVESAWKMGLFMQQADSNIISENNKLRPLAENFIAALESESQISEELLSDVEKINTACEAMLQKLQQKCEKILVSNQLFGLIGGDHSIALAGIRACATQHDNFGILQIDAHMDLRKAYEGFIYSHASIFYNAVQVKQVAKLVQVGIRDYCQEEVDFAKLHNDRISLYTDTAISEKKFNGLNFHDICLEICRCLPEKVYVSFDIDGLKPAFCQHTGTPVPGGLSFSEAKYLLKTLVIKGHKIIGFDLCEVAAKGHEYDGNVGARLTYLLANYMGKSQGLI